MYEIIPFKRVGEFELNAPVSRYLHHDFIFSPKGENEDWDNYTFGDGILEVYTANGIVKSIACHGDGYLHGQLIMGIRIRALGELLGIDVDSLRMETVYFHDGNEQDVYEFDTLDMQVWVEKDGTVVTIFIN